MYTDFHDDSFFEITTPLFSLDYYYIKAVVNQGIDSRLEGFTRSEFKVSNNRLFCWIHETELQILVRRLLELNTESAELLTDDIIHAKYGIEII